MKILDCAISNFGSYAEFSFDFANDGLTFLHGESGSGKSTIPDIVSYLIFGIDSKDSAADDLKSWNTDEPMMGWIRIETPTGIIKIFRTRGRPTENNLVYIEENSPENQIYGKNISDTQKLINERLKCDGEFYLTTSYFHQFSKAETFFVSKPSERRALFEKITDQSVAISLSEKASEAKKKAKGEIETIKKELSYNNGILHNTREHLLSTEIQTESWEMAKTTSLKDLQVKSDNFDTDKTLAIEMFTAKLAQLDSKILPSHDFIERLSGIQTHLDIIERTKTELSSILVNINSKEMELQTIVKELRSIGELSLGICPTCKNTVDVFSTEERQHNANADYSLIKASLKVLNEHKIDCEDILKDERDLKKQQKSIDIERITNSELVNEFQIESFRMKSVLKSENKYQEQISDLRAQTNPFVSQVRELEKSIEFLTISLDDLASKLKQIEHKKSLLDMIPGICDELRGTTLNRVVKQLESDTNKTLSDHFDAEIKVIFSLKDADKLEVEIYKSGHRCSYRRLSGGQRCMLKLAFWLASKKQAENKAGVSVNLLTFDESFAGLSESLKEKAFGLLEDLLKTHTTIVVIDHSLSFKSLFSNVYNVELTADQSVFTKET
jgi:DNA repair exonuclease SbcCD ATPase subunit